VSDEHVAKHEGPRLVRYTPPKTAQVGAGAFIFTGLTEDAVRRANKLVEVLARAGIELKEPYTTEDYRVVVRALDLIAERMNDVFEPGDIHRAYGYYPPDEPCEEPDVDPTEVERLQQELRATEHARDTARAGLRSVEEANNEQAMTIRSQRERIANLELMLAGKLAIAEADPVFERVG
jgi:hypothetical protein